MEEFRTAPPPLADAPPAERDAAPLPVLREWGDALLIAFVLAMFVRIFIVELLKIPSGSMTPTLIGGEVADVDYNGDGRVDLLLLGGEGEPILFLNDGKRLVLQGRVPLSSDERSRLKAEGHIRVQDDRILVNKFAYWFHPPRRGDVVVFKVPDVIWTKEKPIYIKRAAGLPGEELTFDGDGHLLADGRPVTQPPFFARQTYRTRIEGGPVLDTSGDIDTEQDWSGARMIRRIQVPYGKIFVFGDNADSSFDSRYWGGVPLENVKGRAFFRYYPFNQMKFLGSQ